MESFESWVTVIGSVPVMLHMHDFLRIVVKSLGSLGSDPSYEALELPVCSDSWSEGTRRGGVSNTKVTY